MNQKTYYSTSEYVGRGHPDKVADQISDGILDHALMLDPNSKVACETLVKGQNVIIAGEITCNGEIDYEKSIRDTISDIGYNDQSLGFSAKNVKITNIITEQSPEISRAVFKDNGDLGAGDQGIMFGFATNETKSYMPLSIDLAKRIITRAEELRLEGIGLLPDCKAQVTIKYNENGSVNSIDNVVFSTQHKEEIDVRECFFDLIKPFIFDSTYIDLIKNTKFHINPAGPWLHGGPSQDAGVTGRKIVVDNYGCACPVGGGAFSGKDPSKVDRSAAYAARHVAKNIVANKFSSWAQVQISYAIGISKPVSIRVLVDDLAAEIDYEKMIRENWDLSPAGIIKEFSLKRPIFYRTAAHGHFGYSNNEVPWEILSKKF